MALAGAHLMALAEGTPGNWGQGSYPVPLQLGGHTEPVKAGKDKPSLPVTYWPAGPVKLPAPPEAS